jgi:ribosomally synthesized peptide (two-chain TOMM family)
MNTNTNAAVSMQQFGKIWPQCVARAWQDKEFRESLKSDPTGTLRESFQFALPAGFKLEITEGTDPQQSVAADTLRMVIPPAPAVDMRQVAITDTDTGLKGVKLFVAQSFTT